MASQSEIDEIRELFDCRHPARMLSFINKTQAGIGALIRLLSESQGEVTAGMISRELMISTARVAALLNKLADKGLIERLGSVADGRIVVVRLSEKGEELAASMRRQLDMKIARLVDEIGVEELKSFMRVSDRIIEIMQPPEDILN